MFTLQDMKAAAASVERKRRGCFVPDVRAVFVGDDSQIPHGTVGHAYPASGFDDPESASQGAYLFQPDGDENAYYCDPGSDLVMEAN